MRVFEVHYSHDGNPACDKNRHVDIQDARNACEDLESQGYTHVIIIAATR